MAKRLLVCNTRYIADICEERLKNRFATIIVIDANASIDRTRTGKSTLAYKIGRKVHTKTRFKPRRDLVYSRKECLSSLTSKEFGVIILDEGVMASYKRNFQDKEQIDMIQVLNTYADSYNIIIWVVPDFWDLDKDVRKLVNMRITILERGYGLVQIPKPSLFGHDPWDVAYNQKLENEWAKTKSSKPQYAKLTTAVALIHFTDMSLRQREEYEQIKHEKRNRVYGKYDNLAMRDDPERKFYDSLKNLMKQSKLTPDGLNTACIAHGKDIYVVRKKLNKILKEEGDSKRTKDYVMSEQKKQKRDLLGFVT